MSYIGQGLPADVFSGFTTDTFAGDGSATTFTLSKAPFSEDGLIVVINNVIQKPTTNFTVSGTTLTIVGTAVASGDVIYAIHTSGAVPSTLASKVDVNGLSDGIILDADADTTISADTDDQIDIKVGNADILNITNSSSDAVITQGVQDKDILFKGNDGGSAVTALTLDMSDAGAATLNNGLTLTDGNLVVASGHGIDFSANSAATGMTTELLDHYEEGTWSPQLKSSDGTNFTMNSGNDVGYYMRIGNKVFFHAYVVSTSINSAGQQVQCAGLPFTAANGVSYYAGVSVPYAQGLNITAGQNLGGYVNVNDTDIIFFQYNHSTGGGQFSCSSWTDDGGAMVTGHYTVP
jgi:hypothetical protein